MRLINSLQYKDNHFYSREELAKHRYVDVDVDVAGRYVDM